MENDVREVLRERKEEGLHSTSYPVTETFCETGAVYVEFNNFSDEYPRLILARKGETLELGLYSGEIKNIAGLELLKIFGTYSKESIKDAIEFYFSNVCKIIEAN